MPIVFVLLALLLLPFLIVALIPVSLVLRYRARTARQPARRWLATLNVAAFLVSVGIYVSVAALTTIWLPAALRFTLAGLAVGGVLGLLGLGLTRWEATSETFHFTPNRWLVLTVLAVVAARIGFGFWRAGAAFADPAPAGSWLGEAGIAESMGVGAVVLGHGLTYWAGVRGRLLRHETPGRG